MMHRHGIAGLAAAVVGAVVMFAGAKPEVFSALGYAAAKAEAAKVDKLLMVKATAVWCGPCKKMDATTFVDPAVVEYFSTKAIVVEVDVDEEPELAEALGVRAMPTMILFRGDTELDRTIGYRDAKSLMRWLGNAEQGKTALDEAREEAENGDDGRVDVNARLDLARELVNSGKAVEAADEYVWLWNHMLEHEPAMLGVRASFMAGDMERLAKESRDARTKFVGLRDEAEAALEGEDGSFDDLSDWLTLNLRVLGEKKPVLAWIDRIGEDAGALSTLERVEHIIGDLLIEEGRWALLGRIMQRPDVAAMLAARMLDTPVSDAVPEDMRSHMRELHRKMFRERIGVLHAALLAADRDEDAWRIARMGLAKDSTDATREAILGTAKKAGVLRPDHAERLAASADGNEG